MNHHGYSQISIGRLLMKQNKLCKLNMSKRARFFITVVKMLQATPNLINAHETLIEMGRSPQPETTL